MNHFKMKGNWRRESARKEKERKKTRQTRKWEKKMIVGR
jgi:hypothetical protein